MTHDICVSMELLAHADSSIKFVRIADKEGQKKRLSGEGQAFKEELEERVQDALLIAVMMLS